MIAATGYRRLSSSACNALPALAGGIHHLAHVPCLYPSVANSQQYLLRTFCTLYAPLSVLFTAHFVANLVASLLSSVNCFPYTTPMCLTPPLDASAWVEIPLALVGDIAAY